MDQDEEKIAQTDDADKLPEGADKLPEVAEKLPEVAEKHSPDVFDIHSPHDVTEKHSCVVHKLYLDVSDVQSPNFSGSLEEI